MSKKYLLYIHDDQFQLEKNKSELINRLLGEHYASQPGAVQKAVENGDIVFKPGKIIRTPQDVHKAIHAPKVVDKTQEDGKNNSEQQFQTCKEGHPLDRRGKCFGKGCKYSK